MSIINNELYQEDLKSTIKYIDEMVNNAESVSVLIVGATGLIGSYLVDVLVYYKRKKQINIKIGAMGRSMQRLLERFGYCEKNEILFIEHDIQKTIELNMRWDYIFHLASNADPRTYALYPTETITTNVLGTINIIEYAKKYKESRILFASTMEVYGEVEKERLVESDYGAIDFSVVRNGYPESKRVSELLYRSAIQQYNIKCVIARLGYIYGPTMTKSDNKVMAQFIRKVLQEEDIVLQSEGVQRRTYCYVLDAVNGMITALVNGNVGDAYNIADHNSEISIRELANLFADLYNIRVECEGKKTEKKVFHTVLGTEKIESLGWMAENNLENGIRKSVEILSHDLKKVNRNFIKSE